MSEVLNLDTSLITMSGFRYVTEYLSSLSLLLLLLLDISQT